MASIFQRVLGIPILLLLLQASERNITVNGLSTVVYGPTSKEIMLLVSKISAREGIDTSTIVAAEGEANCRSLMYGKEYARGLVDAPGCAKLVSSGETMAAALETADSMVLIGYEEPLEEANLKTLLDNTSPALSNLVLLSRMGVTRGALGGGGKFLESETKIRNLAQSRNLGLSIVRAGTLKGGGPGRDDNDMDDFGLDKTYYNTLFDSLDAKVTMCHDKFALGADCSAGDEVKIPNMFVRMGTKSSFEACPSDSNRIVVAGATVASLLAASKGEMVKEVSVGTAAGEVPPTMEEWMKTFKTL